MTGALPLARALARKGFSPGGHLFISEARVHRIWRGVMPNLMDASFLLTISKAGNLNTPFAVDGYPPHKSRLLGRHGTAYRCVASEYASCENSDVPLAWHNGPAFNPESSVVPIRPTEDPNDHQGSSWKEARLQTEEDAHEACSYASHLLLDVVFPRPLMAGNVEAPLDCLSFLGNPTEMLAVNTMSQLNMGTWCTSYGIRVEDARCRDYPQRRELPQDGI